MTAPTVPVIGVTHRCRWCGVEITFDHTAAYWGITLGLWFDLDVIDEGVTGTACEEIDGDPHEPGPPCMACLGSGTYLVPWLGDDEHQPCPECKGTGLSS